MEEVAIQLLSKPADIEALYGNYAKLFENILSFSLISAGDIEVTVILPLLVAQLLDE